MGDFSSARRLQGVGTIKAGHPPSWNSSSSAFREHLELGRGSEQSGIARSAHGMGSGLESLPSEIILGFLNESTPRNSRAGARTGQDKEVQGEHPWLDPPGIPATRNPSGVDWDHPAQRIFPLPRCHFLSPRLSPTPTARKNLGKALIPTFSWWADSQISILGVLVSFGLIVPKAGRTRQSPLR